MGSIGFGELLLLLAAAYFITGPERFSRLMRSLGREVGKLLKIRDQWEESILKDDDDSKET